jgi:riboflavin kinase/FMN adenylyltransferase
MPLAVLHSLGEWTARFGGAGAGTVLTVGNFDGVHRGHQKILNEVLVRARAVSAVAAAVTFDPHPLKVLRPAESPILISTLAQRLAGIEAAGLDAALVLLFNRELSQLSPEEFVHTILVEKLGVRGILVGDNFRFGHRQAGDVRLLAELGRKYRFDVEIVKPVVVRGEVVSSTAIRQAVQRGEVEVAGRLLGRPFALTGQIQRGEGRGAKVLFPTLNLAAEQELLPARGVYATETLLDGRCYRSATNVGVRPTFDGSGLTVESHLFGFSAQVTSGAMEVRFWKRLREEKKFSGVDELRAQIAKDIARARSFFARLDRERPSRRFSSQES